MPNTRTFAADDVCEQRLAKTLAQLDKADEQLKARDAEKAELKKEIKLQDDRYLETLALLKEYAALDTKGKKSWWKKAGKKLLEKLDQATDPRVIAAVIQIAVLANAVKD